MKTMNPTAAVAAFNAHYPIGTEVMRYKRVNPLRDGQRTLTRSIAWLMGEHTAVVMVEGVSGCVSLESVVPIERTTP